MSGDYVIDVASPIPASSRLAGSVRARFDPKLRSVVVVDVEIVIQFIVKSIEVRFTNAR